MPTHRVYVPELWVRCIELEAANPQEAITKAKELARGRHGFNVRGVTILWQDFMRTIDDEFSVVRDAMWEAFPVNNGHAQQPAPQQPPPPADDAEDVIF